MYDGKKYPLDKNLTYFLVEFILLSSHYHKNHKNVYFPNLFPKMELCKVTFSVDIWRIRQIKYVM